MLRRATLAALIFCTLSRVIAADVLFKISQAGGAPVANAVVALVPLDASAPPPPSAPVEVTQKNKEFVPEVTTIAVGTPVIFSNREPKGDHHIYSLSEPKKFEIPLHKPASQTTIVFDKPGVVVLGCNVHDWMRAYVVVLPTPWFAKTDARGTAAITPPTAGRYRAEVWHARLEKPEVREVTLPTSEPLAFTLALGPEQRIRRGPSAIGGGYK